MTLYSLVQNNIPGPPGPLPVNWANISNFYALDAVTLASHGFYPVDTAVKPAFDPNSQKLVEHLQFGGGRVSQSWTVEALTQAEYIAIATARINEIGGRISAFLDTQVAVKSYDSVISATSWIQSGITSFKTEGQQAAVYRDQIWAAFNNLVSGVQAGTTPLPTVEGWFSSLPTLWTQPAPIPNSNGTLP